jgi:hypothetical protein
MSAQPGNIPSLDSLRACSTLIVLASHFVNANLIPGGLGVYVFFVISGVDRRAKEVRTYFAGEFLFTQSPSLLPGGVGLYRDRSRRRPGYPCLDPISTFIHPDLLAAQRSQEAPDLSAAAVMLELVGERIVGIEDCPFALKLRQEAGM